MLLSSEHFPKAEQLKVGDEEHPVTTSALRAGRRTSYAQMDADKHHPLKLGGLSVRFTSISFSPKACRNLLL